MAGELDRWPGLRGPADSVGHFSTGIETGRHRPAAYRKGILHRGIKPENIFVSKDGGVKILDFGLTRSFAGIGPEGSTMTERSALTTPPCATWWRMNVIEKPSFKTDQG